MNVVNPQNCGENKWLYVLVLGNFLGIGSYFYYVTLYVRHSANIYTSAIIYTKMGS